MVFCEIKANINLMVRLEKPTSDCLVLHVETGLETYLGCTWYMSLTRNFLGLRFLCTRALHECGKQELRASIPSEGDPSLLDLEKSGLPCWNLGYEVKDNLVVTEALHVSNQGQQNPCKSHINPTLR